MRVGPRYNVVCSSIVAGNQNLPWVDKIRYLGIFFVSSRNLKCSLDHAKRSFYRSVKAVFFGKVGRLASEDVVLHLYIVNACLFFYTKLKSAHYYYLIYGRQILQYFDFS